MKVTTADCKRAIVEWVKQHPGHVRDQFVYPEGHPYYDPDEDGDGESFSEEAATIERNWKRMSKERYGSETVRGFDCDPYEAQLRAYVTDDGTRITSITVQGE